MSNEIYADVTVNPSKSVPPNPLASSSNRPPCASQPRPDLGSYPLLLFKRTVRPVRHRRILPERFALLKRVGQAPHTARPVQPLFDEDAAMRYM